MNYELIKNGFPICIIYGDDRFDYYNALDISQTKKDYSSIIEFIEKSLIKTFEFYFEQISVDWKKEIEDFYKCKIKNYEQKNL